MKILFALTLATTLSAQQVVTIGVEGNASGLDLWNNRSETRVQVGDGPLLMFRFAPGDTPAAVAQMIVNALAVQNIAASQVGATVRIASDRNGAPLRNGVDVGTNDTGHIGIVAGLEGVGPASDRKTSGISTAIVAPGAANMASFGGLIGLDVDVEQQNAAGPAIVRYPLVVPFFQFESSDAINQSIVAALGVVTGNAAVQTNLMPSVMNLLGAEHLAFQIDRDASGFPVRRVAYRPGQQFDMRWMEMHAGREPRRGVVDYGQPWNMVQGRPQHVYSTRSNLVGLDTGITVDTHIPSQFCGVFLGLGRAEVALPFLGGEALLLVDPAALASWFGIADPSGVFEVTLPVPPVLGLSGLPLHWQAADNSPLGGPATTRLSPGLLTVLWP